MTAATSSYNSFQLERLAEKEEEYKIETDMNILENYTEEGFKSMTKR